MCSKLLLGSSKGIFYSLILTAETVFCDYHVEILFGDNIMILL